MNEQAAPPTSWRKPAFFGFFLIILTFIVMGGWSAYAKLASAAVASGTISVESNRKTVQHLEGGIIRKILVREGQRVKAGDVLFRLDETKAKASASVVRQQLDALLAIAARLSAEQKGASKVAFPKELLDRKDDPHVRQVVGDQAKQFEQRRASIEGQKTLLRARVKQFETEIEGLKIERESTQKQLETIKEELKDLRNLYKKALVQKTRVLALERAESKLQGVIGRSIVDTSKARNGINETRLQIQQLDQKMQEEVAGALVETRAKIADMREKLRVALDVLKRLDVVSPRSGVIQNLKVFTAGAVIKPGDALLDVAPEDEKLIVQARVSPLDIDALKVGLKAEIRLPSFTARHMPIIFGTVRTVSRDSLTDEATKQPYYLAQVDVIEGTVPPDMRKRLVAGMPAEIVIPTGSRTVLDYIVEPLADRLRKTWREE